MTSIGDRAFGNCIGLTSIIVEEGNTQYHSSGNCLIETETKKIILGCQNSVIPNDGSVTSIGSSAFENCSLLTSITIPDSVTSIGSYAFYNCSGLTNVLFGENSQLTSIGSYAFYNCSGLTSIVISDSVTSIGYRAFYNCSGLTSIEIPSSVTSIGDRAFENCSSLTSITIPDSVTSIGNYAFYGCSSLTNVTFENTSGWWVSTSSSASSGTSISESDLADPSTAATYLTSTYYNYYWKRS